MRQLILLFITLIALAAAATPVDSVLAAFDRKRDVASANAFFKTLRNEQFIDEDITYAPGTARDTLSRDVWYWAAEYLYAGQQYPRAISYGERALPLYTGDDAGDCLNLLAVVNIRLGDWDKAAQYAKRCNAIDRRSGDPDMISSSLNTLAAIYMGARQPAIAEKYILEGIEQCRRAGNASRMATLQGMASEVYHTMGDEQRSLTHATRAWQIEDSLGRADRAAVRLSQMAAALLWLKRTGEARAALDKAIPVLRASDNKQSLGIALNQSGGVYLADGDNNAAAACYREAIGIFTSLHDLYNESHAQLGLYNALKGHDNAEAMSAMERYKALKDSLYDIETAQSIGRTSAELDNEGLMEANSKVRDARRRTMLIGIAVAAFLLMCSGIVWWVMRRRQQRQSAINTALESSINELRDKYDRLQLHYDNVVATTRATSADELTDAERAFLEELVTVTNNLVSRGEADATHIAAQMNMSAYQLRTRFATMSDEPLAAFILNVKMKRACHFLDRHPELSIAEVAMLCGYNDAPNFTRAFKRTFGITPSEYTAKGTP